MEARLAALRSRETEIELRSDAQSLNVLRFGRYLMEICTNEGWTCEITPGARALKQAFNDQKAWFNPGMDPDKSPLNESNSLSVIIRDGDGRFVASNGLRLFLTESFNAVMQHYGEFYGNALRVLHPVELILPDDYPDLVGSIAYSGGTLVAPHMRGRKLGMLTTRLVRVLGERLFRADHHAGHLFQNHPGGPVTQPYHFTRCVPCKPHLHIPDRWQDDTLYLVEMTREEFLAQVDRNLAELVAQGDQTLADLALLGP